MADLSEDQIEQLLSEAEARLSGQAPLQAPALAIAKQQSLATAIRTSDATQNQTSAKPKELSVRVASLGPKKSNKVCMFLVPDSAYSFMMKTYPNFQMRSDESPLW